MSRHVDRRRLVLLLAAVALLAASLIGASLIGSREPTPSATPLPPSSFAGIPQSGPRSATRPPRSRWSSTPTWQCPYCAEWATRTLPVLVDEYVRTGKVRIVFRGLAFIGPESERALRVTLAAGRQNRLWDVLEALYHRQGTENSGWVTDQMLEEIPLELVQLDSLRPAGLRPAIETALAS